MDVRCDKCQARYRIDDARVGPQGLTMRCGKCQNTFKVQRPAEGATAGAAAPAKPTTAARIPSAAKPTTPLTDESAGRTMMFGPVPSAPGKAATPTKAQAQPQPAENESGATMVFGSTKVSLPPSMPRATPAAPDAAGSTLMFGTAKVLLQKPAAAATPPPEPEPTAVSATERADAESENETSTSVVPIYAGETPADPEPEAGAAGEPEQPAAQAGPTWGVGAADAEPEQARPGEQLAGDDVPEGAETGESALQLEGTFARPPSKGLLIGLGVGATVLLLVAIGVVVVKRSHQPPPPAALEALSLAQAAAEKDTLTSLAEAETQAKVALEAAPKGFSQGQAALAEVYLQWFDALNDQLPFWTEKGNKASQDGDEKRKAEAEAKVTDLAAKAQQRLKAAFAVVQPAVKSDPKSPDLSLALADYYRAAGSGSQMNKELKRAAGLKADASRVALIQAEWLQAEDDGAEKALPKLKEVLASSPQSARLHFRLALDYLALHQDAEAIKEVKETLRLSPQHERARLAIEQLATAAPAANSASDTK